MRRGLSIPIAPGRMICPICGENYDKGSYREHSWASSQHVSALAERRRPSR